MKNQTETIRRMVSYLNNEQERGGFWLPNIQRPFVWSEDQITRLFDSIMRDYPISTFLVWRTSDPVRHKKFIDNYRKKIKASNYFMMDNGNPKLLVLDGQQRLQSLFIGLKGSYDGRELYFNILSGDLVAPDDIRYKFKFLHSSKAEFPWVKFKDIVFSNESANRITKSIIRTSGRDFTDDEELRVNDNVDCIWQQFSNKSSVVYQELDSIDNPAAYSEEDVVEIFIRANSGGTHLSKSDLLFSLLSSDWDDALTQMDELLDDLNQTAYNFNRDFVLKTCLTLLEKGAEYEVKKFRDGETREILIERWNGISDAIKDVRDYIYGRTFLRTHKAIPSYLALIPIIYYRYCQPDEWNRNPHLNEYLLRALICGAFNGKPDNVIDKCTASIKQKEEFNVEEIFSIIRKDGRNLEITEDYILDLKYGDKEVHLIFNLWYKDFNYTPAYEGNIPQVDHIFPQSLLKKKREFNPETRGSRLKYHKEDRDQIANLMLLTAEENGPSGKGDTPPDVWFADKDDAYLEMHLIPKNPELWKLDNYEQFVEERMKLILEKFGYMIQGYKSE